MRRLGVVTGVARRFAEPVAVVAVAAMSAVVVSVVLGISQPLAILAPQGLVPFVLLPAYAIAPLAVLHRRRVLAVSSVAVAIAHLVLCTPAATEDDQPRWAADAPTFTLFSGNLRFDNAEPQAAVRSVMAADADVVVLNEIVPTFRDLLRSAGAATRYPTSVASDDRHGYGEMIMTRLPVVDSGLLHVGDMYLPAVTVAIGARHVRIIAVHPPAAQSTAWSADAFEAEQRAIRQTVVDAARHGPAVMAGDFNVTAWNQPFVDLLAAGLHDSHDVLGQGLQPSWGPVIFGWFTGPVLRLDHCVFSAGVSARSIREGDTPGSDHRPFVVTLAVRQDGAGASG